MALAKGINGCMEYSAKSLGVFLHSEGVDDIPIGIDLAATNFGGNPHYQKRLTDIPSNYNSNADAEDAVRLYRRILAESKEPPEIMEIGYLQVISNVIESKADAFSDKNGLELIKEKVSKIWVMAGKWDENPEKIILYKMNVQEPQPPYFAKNVRFRLRFLTGNHKYVIKKMPDEYYKNQINKSIS